MNNKYCNNCAYLNVTEIVQNELKRIGIKANHWCKKYNTQVFHEWSNNKHSNNILASSKCNIGEDEIDNK